MTESYQLSAQQLNALMAAPGPDRYKHFISRSADCELVWGLRNAEGWVTAATHEGTFCFAVWPHPKYAAACATGDWHDCAPASINVDEFVEDWLTHMALEARSLTVFMTPTERGVVVTAKELQAHLSEELARY